MYTRLPINDRIITYEFYINRPKINKSINEEQSSKSLSPQITPPSQSQQEGRNQAGISAGRIKSRASRKIPKCLDQKTKNKNSTGRNKNRDSKAGAPPFSIRRGRVPHGIEVVVMRRRMDRGLRVLLQVRRRRDPVVHGYRRRKEQTLQDSGEDQETEDPKNRRPKAIKKRNQEEEATT